MQHTGKKDSKKEKEKKNKVAKNLPQGDSKSDPPKTSELNINATIHWTTSVSADGIYSFSKVIDSFQRCFFLVSV